MNRHLTVLFLILLTNFSFSQVRTIILTQTHADAIKGIDRKAWAGLGNVSNHSDGYANDFTLPAKINPCEKITNVKVDVKFTGYSKTSACPHFNTYFNLFYGCTKYTAGATCLPAKVISDKFYPVNTNPATLNFTSLNFPSLDFGGNLSVDIIPVSNPGCNPVMNGGLIHQYTTTVTVTITDFPLKLEIIDPTPVCSGGAVDIKLPAVTAGSTTGTTLTYWTDAAATISLPNPSAITTSGTYYVKSTLGSCSITKPVLVSINSSGGVPTPGVSPISYCQNSIAPPLTATPATTATLNWYGIDATGGIASTTAPIPSTASVGTTTYYVSQSIGTCESPRVAIDVTVNPKTTPTFAATQAICSGDTLFTLPLSSSNSIAGTWLPAFDNTKSDTYTFTPTAGQCATTAPLTITVNSKITPIFAAIPAICSGDTLFTLPLSSGNSITGTWLPAFDNTKSDTYTFTPTTGQCATIKDLTITVNSPSVSITAGCIATNYTLEAIPSDSNVTYSWFKDNKIVNNQSANTFVVKDLGTYKVIINNDGCNAEAIENVTILNCNTPIIPKGVSPNNDDLNDNFDLSNFNVSKLEIFNRYGIKVYSKSNYTNEWTGTSDDGQELPDATYYYVVELEGGDTKTGWVYINRQN
jgi:gliding motility-associated-like protein